MKEKRYFAGANTVNGFVSYYNEIFKPCKFIYVIKGGSGTGKSRLMREVAIFAESEGADVEYFYCSFDPESLDGIIINRELAVIDGTAPHVYEPTLPGIKENIIDLGAFWNEGKLRESESEIRELLNDKRQCFDLAYSYLNAVGALERVKEKISNKYIKMDEISANAAKAVSEIKPSEKGRDRVRIVSALGRKGLYCFNTFKDISTRRITLYNKFGEGYAYLEAVKKEAERFGISTTVSYHPLFPWRINALVLGEECSLFVEESAKGSVSEAEEIDKQINALVKKAEGCLTEASNVHFNIESIYVSAMDFVKKESFTSDFIDKLRSSNALTNIK